MAIVVNADSSFAKNLLQTLNDFRLSGTCVDTKLIIQSDDSLDRSHVWCHKSVVAAASPFFRGLFLTEMREKAESSAVLYGISQITLQHVLNFIYVGQAFPANDVECIALLSAAGYFAMDDLIHACVTALSSSITVKNCLLIEHAAEASNSLSLLTAARQFALANFEAVCHTPAFFDLEYNRLLWYIQNYADGAMGIGSEHVLDGCDTVYRALEKWTSHQQAGVSTSSNDSEEEFGVKEKEVFKIHSASQLNYPTVQSLFAQLLSFSIIDNSPPVASQHQAINKTASYHFGRTSQIGVFIVACGRSTRTWAFSQKRNSWLALPCLPNPIRKAGLCALAGSLYVVGGTVNGQPCSYVWRLDVLPASWHLLRQPADERPVAKWILVKELPNPRAGHAVAAIGDRYIVVVGGYSTTGPSDQIVCYDRVKNDWVEVGRCASIPRVGARLAVIANCDPGRSRHSSASSCASEQKPSTPQLPISWTLLEVGGLQAGGRLAVIDCYLVTYPQISSHAVAQSLSADRTLMPDSIAINFSGEQLLLPQPVRFAEPVVLSSDNEGISSRYGENSSRLLVVCSDFGSQTSTSSVGAVAESGYCFVLSFDLQRRLCRMVAPTLPSGTRIRPSVARNTDGSGVIIAGGRVFTSSNNANHNNEPDLDEVHGGRVSNFRAASTVELFEEETREWKRLSDMPEPRSGHCSALLLFVNY